MLTDLLYRLDGIEMQSADSPLVIAPLMVKGEEGYLARIFGKKYLDYCTRVPCYLGLIRP